MSAHRAVVLVGPATTVGPHRVPDGLDIEALASIDDAITVIDDRVVSVDVLWATVLRHAVADAGAVLLVCPSWWDCTRIRRVTAAAETICGDVAVLRRWEALHSNESPVHAEVAPDLIAIQRPGSATGLVARIGDRSDIGHAVLERLGQADHVVIDAPSGVDAADLIDDLIRTLRDRDVCVTVADDTAVVTAAGLEHESRRRRMTGRWARRRPAGRLTLAAGVVLTVSVLAVAGLRHDPGISTAGNRTWLVEGRVAVEVPADWSAERIVVGPGSARVQVISPTDPGEAIHVTQSRIPGSQSLAAAAETVRTALGEQPDGVFGDFNPVAVVAGEEAITYRETRPDRIVDWTLVLDGGVRIAVGCQHVPGAAAPDAVCEHAIRSAHEWR